MVGGIRDQGSGIGPPIPDPRSPTWDDMVLVGLVARPHGLRGQVAVHPETDFVETRFQSGATVWTRCDDRLEALVVESIRLQGGRLVIAFEGHARREDAERLAGAELRVPETMLQPLESGQYYEHQLVGCRVETVGNDVVGSVVRVEGGAGGSRLVVDGRHGEIQIPLATGICVEIDVAGRRIRVDPPEGLLELNETKRSRQSAVGRGGRQ